MVALRKPKPFTVDELEAQLAALRADVDKTSGSLDVLKGRRRELLLIASDAEVVAHDDAVAHAERQIERLQARADALEEVLSERRIEEAEAAKAADRAQVEATVARARQALAKYEQHAKAIVEIIKAVAEGDAAIEQFQRAHPDDETIASAEIVREIPGLAEQVLSTRRVSRWVFESSGRLVPSEHEHLINKNAKDVGKGVLRHIQSYASSELPVECRLFSEVRFKPRIQREWVERLDKTVQLPGITARDPPFWPHNPTARPAAKTTVDERQIEVRYEPIDDATEEAEAT
jgi:uncharacterized coiled-coil protein SlyX